MTTEWLTALSAAFLLLATLAWASSVFSLPGNWIMLLLALLYGWGEGFRAMRPWVLATGFVLFAVAEVAEHLSGYLGARTFGGSRWSGLFALVGAIAGALLGAGFGYGLGAIPGTVLGAFLGALASEFYRQRHAGRAALAGLGAALGRAVGLGAKLGCGGAFLALAAVRVLWVLAKAWGGLGG